MRLKRVFWLFIFLEALVQWTFAETPTTHTDIENIIQDIYYQLTEEDGEVPEWEELHTTLTHFQEHPINLNHTTKEELEQLHILSDLQIENILYYLYRHGKMHSIYELRLIEGLENYHIRNLLPFVYAGKTNPQHTRKPFHYKEVFAYGKHQVLFRLDRGAETREGYRTKPEDEDILDTENATPAYKGDPFYTSIRYNFRYKQHVHAGLRMEKDAGEQFWGTYNKGFDSYGAYVQINNVGCLRTLVVGDFKANFGQGLILNTDFRLAKSTSVLKTTSNNTLRKSSSTDEYNFFRGIGASLQWTHWNFTSFYSYRRLDADTTDGYIHSIASTGLHRTETEYAKQHTTGVHTAGMSLHLQYTKFKVGANLLFNHFSLPFHTSPTLYNQPSLDAQTLLSGSIDYQGKVDKFFLFGETAITHQLGWATLNGLKFYPCDELGLVALHRYYSGRFDSFWGNAFGETSAMRNEQGVYIGVETTPFQFWKFTAYADVFQFPYPKYGIDQPSEGFDYMMEAVFSPTPKVSMILKSRWKQKMTNKDAITLPFNKAQLRYQLTCKHNHFTFKSRLDGNLCKTGKGKNTYGYSIAQDIIYNNPDFPLSGNVRLQMFHTETYDNRIYLYENDVLYSFANPISYGTGCRYYLNLKFAFKKWFSIWFKAAQTIYADQRTNISSGYNKISGNRQTDFRLLLKFSI